MASHIPLAASCSVLNHEGNKKKLIKMSKKGQITILIIAGIVLLGMLIIFSYTSSLLGLKQSGIEQQKIQGETALSAPVEAYTTSCISSTAKDGILENSRQSGYFILPDNADNKSTTDLYEDVAYYYNYYNNDEILIPSLETFAQEIARYIDTNLYLCLDDFNNFKNQGYDISFDEPFSKGILSQDKLIIITTLPIKIKKDNKEIKLSEFTVSIPAEEYYQDIMIARKIVDSIDVSGVCISCFSSLAAENNVFVEMLEIGNNTTLFEVSDNDYFINNEKYMLRFAARYHENETTEE